MALAKSGEALRIGIKVRTGYDDDGKPVYASRNYSNVNPAATLEQIDDFLTKLHALQKYTLLAKNVTETYQVIESI